MEIMESHSSEFDELVAFESFKRTWSHYGFGTDQQELIQCEFKRINGESDCKVNMTVSVML